MALLNFDATNVAPSTGREPIPGGLYLAKITTAEIKPTNDGSGKRLNLQFKVMGGEFDGRVVFAGLNIENKSEQAQKIAQGELSAICHAINVLKLTSTDQLLEKPLRIKVKIKAATMENGAEKYPARNEIDSYEAAGNGSAGPATQRPATGGQARPAAATTRPAGFASRPATAAPAAAQGGEQAPAQTRPARPATRPAAAAPAPAPAPEPEYTTDVAEGEWTEEQQGATEEQPWDE